MAWEKRAGTLYYYRSKKTADGRVVKEYLGRGPRAQHVAQAAAEARRRAEEERRALTEEKGRLADLGGVTERVYDAVLLLTEAILLSQGYHRPKYRAWRSRNGR
jgi:hypothetical protein